MTAGPPDLRDRSAVTTRSLLSPLA